MSLVNSKITKYLKDRKNLQLEKLLPQELDRLREKAALINEKISNSLWSKIKDEVIITIHKILTSSEGLKEKANSQLKAFFHKINLKLAEHSIEEPIKMILIEYPSYPFLNSTASLHKKAQFEIIFEPNYIDSNTLLKNQLLDKDLKALNMESFFSCNNLIWLNDLKLPQFCFELFCEVVALNQTCIYLLFNEQMNEVCHSSEFKYLNKENFVLLNIQEHDSKAITFYTYEK